jgi:hypothetical protein
MVEYQKTSFMGSYKLVIDLRAGLYFGTEMCASGIEMTQKSIWLHGNSAPLIVMHEEVRSEMK